ncbi:uncharacterized protein LOC110707400 [Chenopodium quinoa]|uniref:Retrotransposon gag domain-containing protein n=1 Tax=Chenopodium quinoa TaxID=63459 RepID=A0A803MAL6_CHEQI|nr:uncharacterized protein LOC110707400 [Chenopodium quinoa]
MAESQKFHPALTISNVKSLVPVTLDNEQKEAAKAAYNKAKSEDLSLWKRLDATVLKWIYGTISSNLLYAILKRDDTAKATWKHLEALFQDNKASRATHLDEEFTNALFEDHNSIDTYCNYLQSIADRLADVDAPVSNNRLVLRLTGSLPKAFSGTVDFIQNQELLPSFESCRSRLKMAERTIKACTARESGGSGIRTGALVATSTDSPSSVPKRNNNNNKGRTNSSKNKGKGKGTNQHGRTNGGQSNQPPNQKQQPRQ